MKVSRILSFLVSSLFFALQPQALASIDICGEARTAGVLGTPGIEDPGCAAWCGPACNFSIPNLSTAIGAIGAIGEAAGQMQNLPYANCVLGGVASVNDLLNGECRNSAIFSANCASLLAGSIC